MTHLSLTQLGHALPDAFPGALQLAACGVVKMSLMRREQAGQGAHAFSPISIGRSLQVTSHSQGLPDSSPVACMSGHVRSHCNNPVLRGSSHLQVLRLSVR